MSLGLSAPVARFIRAIFYAAVSAGITAIFANVDPVKEIIVDAIKALPIVVSNPDTIALIIWTSLAGALQAADKALRDSGKMPEVLE